MVVGRIAEQLDLLVVGGGPGGYTAALHGAAIGRSVLLIERRGPAGLGGVCLNEGCIPSKALIDLAAQVKAARFPASGIHVEGWRVDLAGFNEAKAERIAHLRGGIEGLLQGAGVRVENGHVRFAGPRTAVVSADGGAPPTWYEFRDVVIATGSRSTSPQGLEPDGERVLDAAAALELAEVPESIVVVGGGYIGLELGQAFARLGSDVTVVEALPRILSTLPTALARPLLTTLQSDGVEILTDSQVVDLDASRAMVKSPSGERWVGADCVLVAVGRRPNTDDLGLDRLGVQVSDDGRLPVDGDLRLGPHVAAIGDVVPGPALAHKATAEARVAVDALSGVRVAFEPLAIPQVIFTDPEIASAGLTLDAARAVSPGARAVRLPFSSSGRATLARRTAGFAEVVVDGEDCVVGVHVVGPYASEVVTVGVHAIEMGAALEDIAETIAPHPTFGEILVHVASSGGTPEHAGAVPEL